MDRHPQRRIMNIKRYIQTKKKKARAIKKGINDLEKEKRQMLEITKTLLAQFSEVREKASAQSSNNKELILLVKKMNKKIDVIRVMLVNEENKTKAQTQKLEAVDSNLAEFVYTTIHELNELTKESRIILGEFEQKNKQGGKLFPSLFDIHSIPQESKSSRKKS